MSHDCLRRQVAALQKERDELRAALKKIIEQVKVQNGDSLDEEVASTFVAIVSTAGKALQPAKRPHRHLQETTTT